MARTIDETLAAVTQQDTRVDSIIAFVGGLKQQLQDALSGTTLPPAVQAAVDKVFDGATANAAKIDVALNTDVPPIEPPPPSERRRGR